jgi:hypothetical protein
MIAVNPVARTPQPQCRSERRSRAERETPCRIAATAQINFAKPGKFSPVGFVRAAQVARKISKAFVISTLS